MKTLLYLLAVLVSLSLTVACDEKPIKPQPTILDDISGVWVAKGDNTLVSIDYRDNKVRLRIKDRSIPVTLGEIDNDNKTVNLDLILNDGKPGIWTIRQIWDNKEKTSYHLAITMHDGTQDELSFVRKISVDDLNIFANAEARLQSGSIADSAKTEEDAIPTPIQIQTESISQRSMPTKEVTEPQQIVQQVTENNQPQQQNSELLRYKAKDAIEEANKNINIVWKSTTKEIRAAILPEQREWLKMREVDCNKRASNEESEIALQDAIRFNCMAEMTKQRTEVLKQKIASMS